MKLQTLYYATQIREIQDLRKLVQDQKLLFICEKHYV